MGLQMIGLESPSIIFLDEPTSGLDSHQAQQVGWGARWFGVWLGRCSLGVVMVLVLAGGAGRGLNRVMVWRNGWAGVGSRWVERGKWDYDRRVMEPQAG